MKRSMVIPVNHHEEGIIIPFNYYKEGYCLVLLFIMIQGIVIALIHMKRDIIISILFTCKEGYCLTILFIINIVHTVSIVIGTIFPIFFSGALSTRSIIAFKNSQSEDDGVGVRLRDNEARQTEPTDASSHFIGDPNCASTMREGSDKSVLPTPLWCIAALVVVMSYVFIGLLS